MFSSFTHSHVLANLDILFFCRTQNKIYLNVAKQTKKIPLTTIIGTHFLVWNFSTLNGYTVCDCINKTKLYYIFEWMSYSIVQKKQPDLFKKCARQICWENAQSWTKGVKKIKKSRIFSYDLKFLVTASFN